MLSDESDLSGACDDYTSNTGFVLTSIFVSLELRDFHMHSLSVFIYVSVRNTLLREFYLQKTEDENNHVPGSISLVYIGRCPPIITHGVFERSILFRSCFNQEYCLEN